jgi:hypothetical protein
MLNSDMASHDDGGQGVGKRRATIASLLQPLTAALAGWLRGVPLGREIA